MSPPAELRTMAEGLHAHYDVEPELDVHDGGRTRSALIVRLWGVHPKGARALPGDARSRDIVRRLDAIAAWALAPVPAGEVELQPALHALYESSVVPGADEVALGIRIARRTADPARHVTADEERSVRQVRARLRELAVAER